MVRRCVIAILVCFFASVCRSQDEEIFDVSAMLQAAANIPVLQHVASCAPKEASDAFRESFEGSVSTMLLKTRRSMQQGLGEVGRGVILLLDASTCGDQQNTEKLREGADRLRVLAGSRSLGNLDSKVTYEPLKAAMLGDVDIHAELNVLLIAWKLKKGHTEVGEALAAFLRLFGQQDADQPVESKEEVKQDASPALDLAAGAERITDAFWISALSAAFLQLDATPASLTQDCFQSGSAQDIGSNVENAIKSMLEKNRRSMQKGLKLLASSMEELLDVLQTRCENLKEATGLSSLRSAASRMKVLAGAKTLANFGVHVEYEAMQALRIGGIDIHKEVNRFVLAWINKLSANELGESIAKLFLDFKEEASSMEDAPADAQAQVENTATRAPIVKMLHDALLTADAGSSTDRKKQLEAAAACISENDQHVKDFEASVNVAIDHMLQKRKKTMQQGLRELADGTYRLMAALPDSCGFRQGIQTIRTAAQKVRHLAGRTVVDYGKHIKYEAMKSLMVGGVAVHLELNDFIRAWKMESQGDSGVPFGALMQKFATISGHEEL